MHSRRKSREFLLQSLYARSSRTGDFDKDAFIEAYFSGENTLDLEQKYVDTAENQLLAHESELINIISTLAPKFELNTLPVLHIIIIMIALTEIRYMQDFNIPEAVALNEAIELAKRFSDDGGREFVNGVLSSYMKEQQREFDVRSDFRVFPSE